MAAFRYQKLSLYLNIFLFKIMYFESLTNLDNCTTSPYLSIFSCKRMYT